MSGRLDGRVAAISGGASGIGRACALRFADEGADIAVADVNGEGGAETVELVRERGRRALFVATDTTSEHDTEAFVARAASELGRLDVLVAAAGIAGAGGGPGERMVVDKPFAHWQRVLDVNLNGVMLTDRAVARHLIAQGSGGSIVNLASGNGKVPIAGGSDYSVSKAGVIMLTQVLALELARYGIRVNAIGPGFTETPMTEAVLADEEQRRRLERRTPLGRVGQPLDVANTALFLASDESSFMTGKVLFPDGGFFTG
jgi:NAD(P)-dependent dehydrogenase (short-subunit alcohol dehydrogenase family)